MTDPTEIGRYRVLNRIGHGGMGVLYRAIDPVLDREVAIKRLIADFSVDGDEARERFFREAKAAARLQHRNIVTIFDYGEEEGVGFIVLELLRGETLASRLKRAPRPTLTEALDIVIELCSGLDFAHLRGVVHRDIKPANVWLTEDGGVKLLDFGIAKLMSSSTTHNGEVLGTIAYLAPERLTGDGDERADIFSAAAVLFELVTGQRPFDSGSPTGTVHRLLNEAAPLASALEASVPDALAEALAKALEREPSRRFQTAADFALELDAIRLAHAPQDEPTERTSHTVVPAPAPPRISPGEVVLERASIPPLAAPPTPSPSSRSELGGTGRVSAKIWAPLAAAAAAAVLVGVWTSRQPAPTSVPVATQPAVATPATAAVNIVSEPAGAAIRVDGRDTGFVTPYVLTFGDGAAHVVEVSKPGYTTTSTRVAAEEYAAGVVQLALKAEEQGKQSRLVVLTGGNYEFEVWDGRSRLAPAKARHELRVTRGQRLRLVSREIFLDREVRADEIAAGEVSTPALGLLRVLVPVSAPYGGCPVYVDGAHFGDVGQQRALASGPHMVELRCGTDVRMTPAPVRVFVRPGSSPTDLAVE